MAAEAGFDQKLLPVVGFGELEEEDLGVEVVDIGQAQRHQSFRELVGDDPNIEGGESLLHLGLGIMLEMPDIEVDSGSKDVEKWLW